MHAGEGGRCGWVTLYQWMCGFGFWLRLKAAESPGSGGMIWPRAIHGDPVAYAAARGRQRGLQAPRRRYAFAPGRERSGDILALWEAHKDISLEELRVALARVGLTVSVAGLHRFFARGGMMLIKRRGMPSSKTGQTSWSNVATGSMVRSIRNRSA